MPWALQPPVTPVKPMPPVPGHAPMRPGTINWHQALRSLNRPRYSHATKKTSKQGRAVSNNALDLALIPGDGIGPEVTAEALKVLKAAIGDDAVHTTEYGLGAEHWLATGETLTDDTLQALRGHQAILFGAVGAAPNDTRIPSGLLEREILLKLRFAFDHAVNFRPSVLYPGTTSPLANPGNIDFVVFREGTEGIYVGNGGSMRTGTNQEIANETSVNTAYGVERVVRKAFEYAQHRQRQHVTLVHKHNVLVHAGHLWNRIVNEVAEEY